MHGQVVNGVQVHVLFKLNIIYKYEMDKHKDKVQGHYTFLVEIYDGGKHLGTELLILVNATYDGLIDAQKDRKITKSL